MVANIHRAQAAASLVDFSCRGRNRTSRTPLDQLRPQRPHHPLQLHPPTGGDAQAGDLAARRVVFAQGVEGGAAGGAVAGQAAAEGGIVAARVVYRAAQRGQRPGRVAAGVELQAGEPGFRQHVLQAHTFGDAAPGAVGLVDLRGAAQLAFQAVAGDVRGGDQAVRGQFGVGLRFAFHSPLL